MSRLTLVLPALLLLLAALPAQQTPAPTTTKTDPYAALPVEAARQQNPVKPTPESLARGKKWFAMDCAMCHGDNGNGKGETGREMKLTIADFTDPNTLKDRTDGEIFYVIKNGHQDMPPEGPRVKTEENWDLVNYVRSLAKKKDTDQKTP
ncbi:MAG TPA: cytochrome c [Terriglobales bacterium]|nr:cytochrome c [Terriglobales bacterium]